MANFASVGDRVMYSVAMTSGVKSKADHQIMIIWYGRNVRNPTAYEAQAMRQVQPSHHKRLD
jgi:hypothetical protein